MSDTEPAKNISGNTLRVYIFVLTHGPSELREIQRGLGFSTPSLASYHLGKLVKAGYVKQDADGRYVANQEVAPKILEEYSKVGSYIVPNTLFFAIFFSILTGYFAYRALSASSQAYVDYLAATSVAMCGVFWYDVVRYWRKLVGIR